MTAEGVGGTGSGAAQRCAGGHDRAFVRDIWQFLGQRFLGHDVALWLPRAGPGHGNHGGRGHS